MQILPDFHPAVAGWFAGRFGAPTEPQERAWPSIMAGRNTLIAAPTGSGKTLAAFLAAIDRLVREALAGELGHETRVVYVSPLKALSNDVQRNLEEPLAGIRAELAARGLPDAPIRTLVRTGDTPAHVRTAMVRRPPHILVTTPESLFILLASEGGRRMLATARTVIVDEIHAVAGSKRGSHLALSLARLEALCAGRAGRPVRIGLSATQRPIEEVARLLVGAPPRAGGEAAAGDGAAGDGAAGGGAAGAGGGAPPDCAIVDAGHRRALDLGIEVPSSPLEAVMAGEVWAEVYDRLAALIAGHRTTLIFVNTRRLAERATRHLEERLGEGRVASHHGSMSRDQRLRCEKRLKDGELSALVATSSLELGIDIGSVDLVCQLASTRSIAAFLQRVGRAGHRLAALPKGRIFPTSRDELVETAALFDAVRRGELDRLIMPRAPLDILAQHIVAAVAAEEWREDDLFALVRTAHPYRDLARHDFDEVVAMLAAGFSTRRGRRGAHLHQDAVNGRLRARKGARLVAMTSGGAIPDTADYQVVLLPNNTLLGTVHEDFAVESLAGDVFQLGNASWRIARIEPGRVLVEDAKGQPPTIPFWLGEAPARTEELSLAVARLREEVAERVARDGTGAAVAWLRDEVGVAGPAAAQVVSYLAAAAAALGAMPSRRTLVAERFFDEAGDMHLVMHAPFGSRLNRAWGLALRKRFCQTFNFELQAAASEDAIILSLGPTHSFPLEDAFHFLHSSSVRRVVTQAVLDSPLFPVRWRWTASRALALPRWRGGRRVPAPMLRQNAEDLIAVVFPDQLACLENIVGEREIPDHPLVAEALHDCLEEAMDTSGLERMLAALERGEMRLLARDVTEPSPLAHEILAARPYAFLDDAPLEERRTQAVRVRRWLDPETASDLGALDPAAIARVREEAWPEAETVDELHDALLTLGFVTAEEGRRSGWLGLFERLAADGRATCLRAVPAGVMGATAGAGECAAGAGEVRAAGGVAAAGGAPPAGGKPAAGTAGTEAPAGSAAAEATPSTDGGAPMAPRGEAVLWAAAERLPMLVALHPNAVVAPEISWRDGGVTARWAREWPAEEAAVELIRGRLQGLGPTTAGALAAAAGLRVSTVETALVALETEGFVLRGRFTAVPAVAAGAGGAAGAGAGAVRGTTGTDAGVGGRPEAARAVRQESWPETAASEWCERRLLARIHRHTLERLRREIEPVSQADFMRFLLAWQHVPAAASMAPAAGGGGVGIGIGGVGVGVAGGGGGVGAGAGHVSGAGDRPVAPPPGAAPSSGVGAPLKGAQSLPALLAQLEGFEAPAAAWEGEILPARLPDYDPLWLDALCLAGRYVWGRWTPPASGPLTPGQPRARRAGPVRATPIVLLPRAGMEAWRELAPIAAAPSVERTVVPPRAAGAEPRPEAGQVGRPDRSDSDRWEMELSAEAAAVYGWLQARGAAFFDEIAAGARLLHTQVEAALGELVAAGLVTADSFTGLRALLVPAHKRPRVDRPARGSAGLPGLSNLAARGAAALSSTSAFGVQNAGRWSLLSPAGGVIPTAVPGGSAGPGARGAGAGAGRVGGAGASVSQDAVEVAAWALLRRYGVVFRRLLEREALLPPWRDLLATFRRLEARGEIRGGRFVDGFSGEQFALAEAVGQLRAIRREPRRGTLTSISAADPLNLVGIVTPGDRLAALSGNRLLFRDGEPIAVWEGRQPSFLVEMTPAERWQAQTALTRRPVQTAGPRLRARLGRSA